MSEPFDPRPISKAAKNERRKLMAINTAGLTVFGIGVVTPLVSQSVSRGPVLTMVLFVAILGVAHGMALRILKGLED